MVSSVPAVTEGLKSTNGLNFDYKDEASAQEAIKDEKIKGYLTIDQEDGVLKAVYHGETSLESWYKVSCEPLSLNELQSQLNRSEANLSQEQGTTLWRKRFNSQSRLMNLRKVKKWSKPLRLQD